MAPIDYELILKMFTKCIKLINMPTRSLLRYMQKSFSFIVIA